MNDQRIKIEVIFKQRDDGWTGHDTEELQATLNTRLTEGWRVGQIMPHPPYGFIVFYERV